ncbi:MAG TPA: ABC transporter ATP-binding protein [Tepidisphaeraceae bacterium]|nr:ABC transporter ATP-binding protein [Tepidisphaeraceae bacterium]
MRSSLRALRYFRPDWPLIGIWLLLIGVSTGVGLLMAWPMAILIDSVLGTSSSQSLLHRLFLWPLPESRLGQIFGLAVTGLLLKFAQDALSVCQSIVSNQINYSGLLRVRCDLYRKLQSLNLAYHRAQAQGDAIYRLSTDSLGCQQILSVSVSAAVALVTLAVMICILPMRSLSLTLLAFSIVPMLALTNIVFARRLRQRTIECKRLDSEFTSTVQRSMACINLVQAFGREAEEFGRFHGTVRETIRAWWGLNREQMAYNLIVGTLFALGGAIVFGYGGYLVYQAQTVNRGAGMTVGDLMIFMAYLGMLWGPICTLTGAATNLQGGLAGAQRVFEVLDLDPVIKDMPDAVALPRTGRVLELDDVSFRYGMAEPVLRGVSVKIEPGQMVAFVGPSGVGKSTVLNLLPRFYDPTGGAIRFDGIDARQVRVKDLRRHVALVLQESVILPTTVAENIAYGQPHATRWQIERAAQLAGAAEFISKLPQGYDTQIAEGGSNLSGGQRQRISIARALLTEAPFVILDEPTSALDPHHEQVVTDALRSLKGSRTIILVSHRLSTVADCDQIFVMDGGRVVEQGTHDALIARRGQYYRMAVQQRLVGAPTPPMPIAPLPRAA